jgi:hypothetical protein
MSEFESGCSVADKIHVPEGFPRCNSRTYWLGELKGSWHDIGKMYGEASAFHTRFIFDYWWEISRHDNKIGDMLNELHKVEELVSTFNPKLVDLLKGQTEGASKELDKSRYAEDCSHYEKFLFLQHHPWFDGGKPISAREKDPYALVSLEGESDRALLEGIYYPQDCTWFAVWGDATVDGNLIVSHTVQFGHRISNYRYSFIATPTDDGRANSFLCNAHAGVFTQLMGCNDKGVSVGVLAHPFDPEVDSRDIGVPQELLRVHALAYSDTKEEAGDILIKGTPSYRKKTGRKILFTGMPGNWVVADEKGAFHVERTAHRYAVRHPAEEDGDFIVQTNHQFSKLSYDENDERTDVSIATDRTGETSSDVPHLGLFPTPGSVTRYWAIYWAIKYNYGRIDERMVKGAEFTKGHHWYSREGRKVEYLWSDEHDGWMPVHYLYPHSTVCGHSGGYSEKYHNEIPNSIHFKPSEKRAWWTLYRPCHWIGPWETAQL